MGDEWEQAYCAPRVLNWPEHFVRIVCALARRGIRPELGWNTARGTRARVKFLSEFMGRPVRMAEDLDATEWLAVCSGLCKELEAAREAQGAAQRREAGRSDVRHRPHTPSRAE